MVLIKHVDEKVYHSNKDFETIWELERKRRTDFDEMLYYGARKRELSYIPIYILTDEPWLINKLLDYSKTHDCEIISQDVRLLNMSIPAQDLAVCIPTEEELKAHQATIRKRKTNYRFGESIFAD